MPWHKKVFLSLTIAYIAWGILSARRTRRDDRKHLKFNFENEIQLQQNTSIHVNMMIVPSRKNLKEKNARRRRKICDEFQKEITFYHHLYHASMQAANSTKYATNIYFRYFLSVSTKKVALIYFTQSFCKCLSRLRRFLAVKKFLY